MNRNVSRIVILVVYVDDIMVTMFVNRKVLSIVILVIYVDDIVVTGNDGDEIVNLKAYMQSEFEVKDLGALRYFLGIEVARSKQGIAISQRNYTLDLLKETGKLGAKPVDTPIEQNHGLHSQCGDLL